MRVLLVDDDYLIRRAFAREIAHHPAATWDWLLTASPEEALSLVRDGKFDVVATDWDLGRGQMNGVDVARAIRAVARTPVLLYSARDWSVEDRAEGLRAGADVTMPTPLADLTVFFEQVRALARRTSGEHLVTRPPAAALLLDSRSKVLHVGRESVSLTSSQALLLAKLIARFPETVTFAELLVRLGHEPSHDRHAIHEALRRLRSKLLPLGVEIEPVSGVGYRLGPATRANGMAG